MSDSTFTVTGLKELFEKLKELPDKLVNRSIVRVNKEVMTSMLDRAIELAPVGVTGKLRESLGIKTKVYKRQGRVFTIIGPTLGHAVLIPGKYVPNHSASFWSGRTMTAHWHDPVRIAHLVERGHGGPKPAGAHSFLGAAARSQLSLIEPRYAAAMRTEIDRLVRKGALT